MLTNPKGRDMKQSKFDLFIKSTNVRNINLSARILNIVFRIGEIIYPKGVADFVRKKFFTPVTKPLTKAQEEWISKASPYKIRSRNKFLQVWKVGNGPSIMFMHGWNGRGVQFHRFFQPVLDAGYSVLFFDAPAHGLSEGEMTNYIEISESLDCIFNHEVGKDVVGVIAHSLGASAIINYMSRHQSDIPLVLIAAALQLMELLFANFQMHGVPRRTYLKLLEEVELEFDVPLDTQNPIDLILEIKNDILIIHDSEDKTTPISPAKAIAHQLENIEILETEGLGHSRLLNQKSVIVRSLDFLIRCQKSKRVVPAILS